MAAVGTLLAALPLPAPAADLEYRAQFRLEIRAGEPGVASGRIRIVQPDARLKRLELTMPAATYSAIAAEGHTSRRGDTVTWQIPGRGGEIRYQVAIDHRRDAGGYDALLTDRWGILRFEDVFPAADAAFRAGARSRSELLLDLPPGWSATTAYPPDAAGRRAVAASGRNYTRPIGWFAVGEIASRKDDIGGRAVRVTGPLGQGLQRVPILALLRWTLPILQTEIPDGPAYLLVVVAGDPMWRGGLSAPNSLFVHASRPLISENGTSTLVHELVHVFAPVPTTPEHDWIDEGIAEYLGLLMLQKSGTISDKRFGRSIETFRRRGSSVRTMMTRAAGGEVKARAVAIFYEVDKELQARSDGRRDIFDLLRRMMRENAPVDITRLRALAAEVAGGPPLRALTPARVPGT